MIRNVIRSTATLVAALIALAMLAVAMPGQASAAPSNTASRADSGIGVMEANCERGPDVYDIGPGNTGVRVREVQCLLNWTLSWGAYPHVIEVDGDYGPITTGAVKKFQSCANSRGYSLAVDGRVGPQTLPVLRAWGQYGYDTGNVIC
ncbi:peptidoglycan-binding domain-containing protein [Catenuloplanes japonicus]|uniref:peptidoglycan-binding domain-containing protein n=1 Tax=Catenuloplanes japonicus TaxID=33876 RepID=UPI000526F579|nr:peptidoglycan-binding domain-containing protein [Catenuloplanes japonicus]